jgi:hypothetical protein
MPRALLLLPLGVTLAAVAAALFLSGGSSSATGGNSITSPVTAGDVGQYSSLALDASGYPVVSFYDKTNENLGILHCQEPNCSSGYSVEIPDTDHSGPYTSLVRQPGCELSAVREPAGQPVTHPPL